MAMPGHSPPFNGPSSPPRAYNGYSEAQQPPSIYGPPARPIMLPPSPQHFPPPRYSQPPLPTPSPVPAANNGPPPPYKRPGSSMSISSMLGTEPDKPPHEQYHNPNPLSRTSTGQSSHSGPSMSLGAVMSPPQYQSKPNSGEYSYKPRSQTPDRVAGPPGGARPHRSSSGSMTQRAGHGYDPSSRQAPPPSNMNTYPEPRYTPPFGPTVVPKDEFEDRTRRTSLSGILQRPESQPQSNTVASIYPPVSNPPVRPESIPPSLAQIDRPNQAPMTSQEPPRSNGFTGTYDTRPPSLSTLPRYPQSGPTTQPAPTSLDRLPAASMSPEMRRPQLNGNEGRGLSGILNQQPEPAFTALNMMRQDSVQSQSDRSVLGDRLRNNRAYSPFAGSVASQNLSTASGPFDDPVRKGSEELSQHRTILGLSNESKRGRYSPLPQAVQGAQAQTPVPDAGIKNEHGRVFAGIGSGMGSASAGPTPTPQPLPASPFKQNEGAARLSEENLMKMSRSASGISKRSRKVLDEDARAESDVGGVKKSGPGRGKRSKHQHSYKAGLEDPPLGNRKNAAFSTSNPVQRAATPTSRDSHVQRQSSAMERAPTFRPKKIIKISSVVALARRNQRRHLGFFKYDPEVAPVDLNRPTNPKFDVSIRPNLLPSFTEAEHINCTYTVRVPRIWLQQKERGLICAERYLWGSGIYTDDSDPVAAAMHSGFIPSVHPAGIDEALLERVIEEQNPRIEGLVAPSKPKPVQDNKDLHITLVVLPQLESYVESVRFGIKSRSWPDGPVDSSNPTTDSSTTPHDGVSFMVLKAEFVDDGVEVKRVGRTGKEKRERLRRELMDRKRGFELEKEKLAMAATRLKEKKEALKRKANKGLATPDSLDLKDKNGAGKQQQTKSSVKDQQQRNIADDQHAEDIMKLDGLGQSPESWINQLKDVAATA